MTFSIKLIFLLQLIAILSSCHQAPSAGGPLAKGDSFNVGDTKLTLLKVNDSRCPKDVMCVTAGSANVTFQHTDGKEFILCLGGDCNAIKDRALVSGKKLILKAVTKAKRVVIEVH